MMGMIIKAVFFLRDLRGSTRKIRILEQRS